MKLVRWGSKRAEKPGVIERGARAQSLRRRAGNPRREEARNVPRYLRAGQTMRLGVSGLGEQQQRLVAEQGGQAQ
ncbi:hypothetical protein M3I53_13900 [Paraburkholderia sp. CNPSo 3272]|uniref:hypothetical protein n=1 Tax=Paraburkholderia sp. CNPSo 3272 TaxID=2940931 RepID=UPI0020B76E05|nr:hypothetical protein [Paraburkholderia sp. CNPSo 3272]MCP3724212.1 hypothetical protein [Paraburkholderia sp. CNPSo 3272]